MHTDLCNNLDWANHGICGRGVLLDMVRYWKTKGTPVDPWTSYAITPKELEGCAKAQGVTFRQGDILLLRVGFIQKYCETTCEERDRVAGLEVALMNLCACCCSLFRFYATSKTYSCSAGIEPTDGMKRFLW